MQDATYIRWFSSLGRDDVATVGGKNASLGELYQHLKPLGVDVPDGFALTATAFRDALTEAKAWDELHALLDRLDKTDVASLARAGAGFRDAVFITGAYGLGETVVQGAVDPDEFYVHKPTFRQGHRAVLRRRLGEKQVKMIYRPGRTREPTRTVP